MFILLALIVYKLPSLWYKESPENQPVAAAAPPAPKVSEEDNALLSEALPKCSQAFSQFLAAGTSEARNQFVLDPISITSRMARFYGLNPSLNIDPQTLTLVGRSVVRLPETKAIETHWKVQDSAQRLDAVFREEYGEWRLDWDHFARYSDFPWPLFLAGTGPSEGEFRLLARERLANERKDAKNISIVLYAPRFGYPDQTGLQSPEFLIARESQDGQLLDAAFKLARSGGRVFGSQLPDWNPDGMIRVRVKIRRIEADMGRKFELTRVVACHWFAVDDPGVDLQVDDEVPAADEPPAAN